MVNVYGITMNTINIQYMFITSAISTCPFYSAYVLKEVLRSKGLMGMDDSVVIVG